MKRGAVNKPPVHPVADFLLDQGGEDLQEEDPANQREQHLLLREEGHHRQGPSDAEGTGVPHEDLRGIGVIPEEAHDPPDESRPEDGDLSASPDEGEDVVTRGDGVPDDVGEEGVDTDGEDGGRSKEPIHAIGDVHGVDDGEHGEDQEEEEGQGRQLQDRMLVEGDEDLGPDDFRDGIPGGEKEEAVRNEEEKQKEGLPHLA
ncbi:MAG: hypothetical protein BWY86_00580 [Candidatus Aminicenantes bacterium ADurb.Bin508]|nr:MAG: hypothetical protein BWY86_00580 [Candidatus Aminicenantes bacterium ADurb.Bin508]